MKEATVLDNNSRIYTAYEKFKKAEIENERARIQNLMAEEVPESENEAEREEKIERLTE